MTSREFFTEALLKSWTVRLTKFYESGGIIKGDDDIRTVDLLAVEAVGIAERLTIQWEDTMAWMQNNDNRIGNPSNPVPEEESARREVSTQDLFKKFQPKNGNGGSRNGASDSASD